MSATTLEILNALGEKGIQVFVEGTRLRLTARPGVVTPALRAEILAEKQALIEAIRQRGTAVPEEPQETASRRLQETGWTVVRSETLGGELVVWVRDSSVTVPDRLSGLVRYTRAELAALQNATEAQLQDIHRAKRELPDFQVTDLTQTNERS